MFGQRLGIRLKSRFAVVPVNSVSCPFDSSELEDSKKEGENNACTLTLAFIPTAGVGNFFQTLSEDVRMVVVPNDVRELPEDMQV